MVATGETEFSVLLSVIHERIDRLDRLHFGKLIRERPQQSNDLLPFAVGACPVSFDVRDVNFERRSQTVSRSESLRSPNAAVRVEVIVMVKSGNVSGADPDCPIGRDPRMQTARARSAEGVAADSMVRVLALCKATVPS